MHQHVRPRIPLRLLVIDLVGIVLAALGLAALVTDLSRPLPFLADRTTAGALTVIGFALITFALGNILRWLKLVRASRTDAGSRGD